MPAMTYFMQNAEQQNLAKMDKSNKAVCPLVSKAFKYKDHQTYSM